MGFHTKKPIGFDRTCRSISQIIMKDRGSLADVTWRGVRIECLMAYKEPWFAQARTQSRGTQTLCRQCANGMFVILQWQYIHNVQWCSIGSSTCLAASLMLNSSCAAPTFSILHPQPLQPYPACVHRIQRLSANCFLYEGFDSCIVGQSCAHGVAAVWRAAQKPNLTWGYIPHLPNKVSSHNSLVSSTAAKAPCSSEINWPDIGSGQTAVQVRLRFIGWWWEALVWLL